MARKDKPSGFKLKPELEKAVALAQAGRWDEVVPLARELGPKLRTSDGWRLLLAALENLGRADELQEAIAQAAADKPGDHELNLRAALSHYERDEFAQAAQSFSRLPREALREPEVEARFAHALLMAGDAQKALARARSAHGAKPSGVPALVLGLAAAQAGSLEEASAALGKAAESLPAEARAQALGPLGLVLFWRGETARALSALSELDASRALDPALLAPLAICAAIHGAEGQARAALARMPSPEGAPARLAGARVELALGRPEAALAALGGDDDVPVLLSQHVEAARGRALRLLGRHGEARAVLEPLAREAAGSVAAMAWVDLGRIASDEGRHEDAQACFARALELDPGSEEAERGLGLARQRQAWRAAVSSDAAAQVASARAEAEAMRRAFAERDRELELLRQRLAQAERQAARTESEADQRVEEARRREREAARLEAEARKQDAGKLAAETLQAAFGEAVERCPRSLLEALRVAETTFQTSRETDLHPAAVAVLYAGALERALYLLIVRPFDQSLTDEARAAFLRGASKELRPGRVEYFERFVEAFDRAARTKAPSLGEISRVLARRNEPHLRPVGDFLRASFELTEPAWDALAAFVERAKQELRDPVAHGRALDLSQEQLASFRQELIVSLPGLGAGAIPALVRAQRAAP